MNVHISEKAVDSIDRFSPMIIFQLEVVNQM